LHFVETLDEDQVRDLLDDLQRVGKAARPEIIPDRIDLRRNSPFSMPPPC
jgi:hypothetical protein